MTDSREIYVIDTSVLLGNPNCIFGYPKAFVIIPLNVIEEVDNFRTKLSENGRNARLFFETLENLRGNGSLSQGITLENGSTLRVHATNFSHDHLPDYLDLKKNPNRMLHAMLELRKAPVSESSRLVLVTNDYGLKIRAASLDIEVCEYAEEVIEPTGLYSKIATIETDDEEHYRFLLKNGANTYLEEWPTPHPNMFFELKFAGEKEMLCRYFGQNNLYRPVEPFPKGVWKIHPRNREQLAALNLLMDRKVSMVTLAGKAGTGKTLLALAAALEQLFTGEAYRKILVSRPIVPMGRELGYLPGDIGEKLGPWMQPIFDNLEYLMNQSGSNVGKFRDVNYMIEKNVIELEALSYIRGRSIPDRFMIVDEAQNLTPHEVKTVITRVGEGTKIVLTGDPFQIDNAYLDKASNGLSHIIERLRSYEIAGHVAMMKGERSGLAELASNVL